jgi:molybdopterin molybdotransferase
VSLPQLSVDEVRSRILDAIEPLPPIELPLLEAHGCVLASDVTAEYDVPPLSTGESEGYAVRAADIHAAAPGAPVVLRLVGWARAGKRPEATVGWGETVRLEAGAPIPAGADSVVPLESCDAEGESVRVWQFAELGAGVRPAGEDVRAGDVLVPGGRRLAAPELGMLAAAGRVSALVHARVRVAVMAAGSLVEAGRVAAFGEARDAVSYLLYGAVRDAGAVPHRVGIVADVEDDLREALMSNLSRADVSVCAGEACVRSGPEPMGGGLGKVEPFRVAAYPGDALAFGEVEGEPYFGLPPSPAAALVCFEAFVRPAILKMMGRADLRRPEVTAVLDEVVGGPAGVTLFAPMRVEHREGAWHARPTGPLDARLLSVMTRANALAVVEPGQAPLDVGDKVRVQAFRALSG